MKNFSKMCLKMFVFAGCLIGTSQFAHAGGDGETSDASTKIAACVSRALTPTYLGSGTGKKSQIEIRLKGVPLHTAGYANLVVPYSLLINEGGYPRGGIRAYFPISKTSSTYSFLPPAKDFTILNMGNLDVLADPEQRGSGAAYKYVFDVCNISEIPKSDVATTTVKTFKFANLGLQEGPFLPIYVKDVSKITPKVVGYTRVCQASACATCSPKCFMAEGNVIGAFCSTVSPSRVTMVGAIPGEMAACVLLFNYQESEKYKVTLNVPGFQPSTTPWFLYPSMKKENSTTFEIVENVILKKK